MEVNQSCDRAKEINILGFLSEKKATVGLRSGLKHTSRENKKINEIPKHREKFRQEEKVFDHRFNTIKEK